MTYQQESKQGRYELFFMILPLFVCIALFELLNRNLLNQLFFAVTFCWHIALTAKNAQTKVMTARYRLSFFKFIFVIDSFFQDFNQDFSFRFPRGVIRSLSPLVFCVLMISIAKFGNPLYPILASTIFELMNLMREEKKVWNNIFSESTQLEDWPEEF